MYRYPICLALMIFLSFPSLPALAEAVDNCAGTQGEMNRCADRLLRGEQKLLDAAYKKILEQAGDETDREMLEASQKAWEAYRDAQCEYEADQFRGGSMAPGVRLLCHAELVRARTTQLVDQIVWPTDLARLISLAGDQLPGDIFWHPDVVSDDFNHDGIFDDAFLGIRTGQLPDNTATAIMAVLIGGSDHIAHVAIPIDGQNGLCAQSISLRAEYPDNQSPLLVVDDGACDAFRFRLLKDQTTFELHRN
ncbi:lysozyme inhibitor LprI family protein [Pseudodesulfovibrio sp. zrk46]|uniref:lysozyme inhibitor LprI family protein n=1 Tax=Pseudodesulfovibrio sp. zrk46 TaxID=2725288 RepID=UPI001448CF6A|nr:lysozyme inhibitor LprI family protein [Pseudodesulfovibrio sp. zrk46]QJB56345.1 DUF1311 domain-containing protein [Pseudodesulfovibrio sp. zrk46]